MSIDVLERGGATGAPEVDPVAPGSVMLSTTVENPAIGNLVRGYQEAANTGITGSSAAAIDAAIRKRDEPAAGWQSFVETPVNPDVDTINPGY